MNKKDLNNTIESIIKMKGFVKKGDAWFYDCGALLKRISFHKSKFGNSYYVNFGYIIKEIELGKLEVHIHNQLSFSDETKNQRIIELLDAENSISDDERMSEIKFYFNDYFNNHYNSVNSIGELKNMLLKRSTLNDIPLIVKNFLNIL